MKHLQLFEQFIDEGADVGKKLFADPHDSSNPKNAQGSTAHRWFSFIQNIYNSEYETNTEFESALLDELKLYYDSQLKSKDLGKFLKELLPLKKKFSKILDPSSYKMHNYERWGSTFSDYAWRGSYLELNQFMKVLPFFDLVTTWKDEKEKGGVINNMHSKYVLISKNPKYVYQTRSKKGFVSFSAFWYTAWRFSIGHVSKLPVVHGIQLNDSNLLINPETSNRISEHIEYETFYVGNSFKPFVMVIDSIAVERTLLQTQENWNSMNNTDYSVETYFEMLKNDTDMQKDFLTYASKNFI